jgi:hypothetical protein
LLNTHFSISFSTNPRDFRKPLISIYHKPEESDNPYRARVISTTAVPSVSTNSANLGSFFSIIIQHTTNQKNRNNSTYSYTRKSKNKKPERGNNSPPWFLKVKSVDSSLRLFNISKEVCHICLSVCQS